MEKNKNKIKNKIKIKSKKEVSSVIKEYMLVMRKTRDFISRWNEIGKGMQMWSGDKVKELCPELIHMYF